jgi:hypothetical protein
MKIQIRAVNSFLDVLPVAQCTQHHLLLVTVQHTVAVAIKALKSRA